MSFEIAIRLTEIMLAFAFIQQSIEHIYTAKHERHIFILRLALSLCLMLGLWSHWSALALTLLSLLILNRFKGPYNGGSDRMGLLILCCLTCVHFAPTQYWKEIAFGYLAIQLTLSYFMSGWVKITNPEWRSGKALEDVFRFSAYPVSEALRKLSQHPKTLLILSWAVIALELLFPLTLLSQPTLILGLTATATFHAANAFLFGLNRFFWVWLAAYPSILWLQSYIL